MKKLLILLLLILTACSNSSNTQAPQDTPKEMINTYQYGDLKYNQQDILDFLNGDWIQMTAPNQPSAVLSFSSVNNQMDIRTDDGYGVYSNMNIKPLYEGDSSCLALIETIPFNATEKTKMKNGDKFEVYKGFYQFFAAQAQGKDYLLLRETGNGLSVADILCFKEENMSPEYTWVFTRETEFDYPNDDINRNGLKKNESFYAYCWGYTGDQLYLQPMVTQNKEVDWIESSVYMVEAESGQVGSTIYRYPISNGATTVATSIADTVQNVVLIETNAKGEIKKLQKMVYAGYGYYKDAD